VYVKPEEIITEVVVANADLANALVRDKTEALKLLASIAPVKATQVGIDDRGRVVIHDAVFAQKMATRLRGPGPVADNGICGFKCGGGALDRGVVIR